MPKVTVHRKAHFNAAHRLFNPKWSDEKNYEVFGKCSNPNYHGHNYELIVSLTGEIDQETGYVYDLGKLKDLIKSKVEDLLDHKNLNIEVKEFKNVNPTVENISVVIYNKLRVSIPEKLDLAITLYETPRNYVTYRGT
ncbi:MULTISPECIES: 6-pyruvoyl trahydropterin synthase family protein [Tenacibaculum]|uniref:6-carboxy-5,6,7,8-tetrahydropterin synthase n=1 Tax=Tenacibaculum mesophilum TaxID=104268 RepID=A0AAE9SDR3_9FLAO|nr:MULTISPECIES: 6-carboxytetrahydropterin synthase [Tenacibaculum]AZJ31321.1 6-carboxytetrahydropterin synthase [Tenacibaculum mesophilum]KAF9660377.1 6-carboxytetrahydropterin synthase [Tenacibaculum mesophilum]MCG7503291.1 6-carboxytetrahydropterin synthase [Tenacibaculum sp. Mcav3-52]QFS29369.1 6-carboxytetrahydropterin synthase [Tenacibaculum mesophilum]UTD13995.1 6-carboxytetrahydropterin synthase [Tenacibaculum mesophilum]